MEWKTYIHSDPNVLTGKPVVKGTRLAVEFILDLFAQGWTVHEVLKNYPTLSEESLRAVFAYASESLKDESFYPTQGTDSAILG